MCVLCVCLIYTYDGSVKVFLELSKMVDSVSMCEYACMLGKYLLELKSGLCLNKILMAIMSESLIMHIGRF